MSTETKGTYSPPSITSRSANDAERNTHVTTVD